MFPCWQFESLMHDVLPNIRVLCFYITLSREDGRVRYVNVMTMSLWSLLHSLWWTCHGTGHVLLSSVFFVGNWLDIYCLEPKHCWCASMLQDVHCVSDFTTMTFSFNIIGKDSWYLFKIITIIWKWWKESGSMCMEDLYIMTYRTVATLRLWEIYKFNLQSVPFETQS